MYPQAGSLDGAGGGSGCWGRGRGSAKARTRACCLAEAQQSEEGQDHHRPLTTINIISSAIINMIITISIIFSTGAHLLQNPAS